MGRGINVSRHIKVNDEKESEEYKNNRAKRQERDIERKAEKNRWETAMRSIINL